SRAVDGGVRADAAHSGDDGGSDGASAPDPDAGPGDDANPRGDDAGPRDDASPRDDGGGGGGPDLARAPAGTPQTSGTLVTLHKIWGSSPRDLYVVGDAGTILHSTGNGVWSAQSPGGKDLLGVWGSSASDLYAVGDGGVIWHSTGDGQWTQQTSN